MRKWSMEELNRLTVDGYKKAEKVPVVVVLDNIRSMHNVGSVFRTADAFLVEAIYLCGFTPKPPHRDIHKTALGATESVNWQYFDNTAQAVHQLKDAGYTILAVEQAEGSHYLNSFFLPAGFKAAVVFGNEVEGVQDEVLKLADQCIEIAQSGTKHSLNISVAAGIVLYKLYEQYNERLPNHVLENNNEI